MGARILSSNECYRTNSSGYLPPYPLISIASCAAGGTSIFDTYFMVHYFLNPHPGYFSAARENYSDALLCLSAQPALKKASMLVG